MTQGALHKCSLAVGICCSRRLYSTIQHRPIHIGRGRKYVTHVRDIVQRKSQWDLPCVAIDVHGHL